MTTIQVTKRSGKKESLTIEKWQAQINKVCKGIADVSQSMIEIKAQIELHDGMSTETIDELLLKAMVNLIDETERRRNIQLKYNQENGITPKQIERSKESILGQTAVADHHFNFDKRASEYSELVTKSVLPTAAEPQEKYMTKEQIEKEIDLIGGLTYELDVKRRQIRLSLMEQLRIKHGQEVHDKLNSAF